MCTKKCQVNVLDNSKSLMIIADYPDRDNSKKDTVLQGTYNKLLHDVLTKVVKVDYDNIHFTYLVKCNPQNNKPDHEHVMACVKYLKEEIEFIKPKSVLLLGAWVSKLLLGLDDDVEVYKIRKDKFDLKLGLIKIPAQVTFPIYGVSKSPSRLKFFAQDVYNSYVVAIGAGATEVPTKVKVIHTIEEVQKLFEYCLQTKICSWDFETNGKQHRPYGDTLFATGLAVSFQHGSGYFIPLQQFDSPVPETQRKEFTLQVLRLFVKMILTNPDMNIVGQNLKFDLHVASHYVGKFELLAYYDDTMYIDFFIDNVRSHRLKEMVTRAYPKYGGYEDDIKNYKWDAIPLPKLSKYACIDSDFTLRIKTRLEAVLMQDTRAYKVYKNIIIPTAITTWEAEREGLKVDRPFLDKGVYETGVMIKECVDRMTNNKHLVRFEKFSRQISDKASIIALQEKLVKWTENHNAGTKTEQKYKQHIFDLENGIKTNYETFNLNSHKQLGYFLYNPEGLGLNKVMNHKTKKLGGTGEDVVSRLNDTSGFINSLLEYRGLTKTQGTYLEGIRKRLDKFNIVHTKFRVIGTDTGRLSSADPNVQNITKVYTQKFPSTKKAAGFIKGMFIPPEGYTIVQIDYKQAELKLIAYYSQCKYMLNAYAEGIDLHAQTAADVMGITLGEFYKLPKDEQKVNRYGAKAVNFGFIYDMSAATFQATTLADYGIDYSLEECVRIKKVYFDKRPEILQYHADFKAKAKHFGHVRTLFGSKRIIKDIHSDKFFKVAGAERQAINTPIQGTCGQLTVFSIAILRHRLSPKVKFVNTVHDSIIYYVPNEMLHEQIKIMVECCENLPISTYFGRHLEEEGNIPVKMGVDVEVSTTNWAELEEYKLD